MTTSAARLFRFPVAAPARGVGVGTANASSTVRFSDSYTQTRQVAGATIPHAGIDIVGDVGMLIIAATAGTVRAARWSGLGGWAVEMISASLASGNTYSLLYAHMAVPPFVVAGAHVEAGALLGVLGQTGGVYNAQPGTTFPSNPHLHFSTKRNGHPWNPYAQLASLATPITPGGVEWRTPQLSSSDLLAYTTEAIERIKHTTHFRRTAS